MIDGESRLCGLTSDIEGNAKETRDLFLDLLRVSCVTKLPGEEKQEFYVYGTVLSDRCIN